ncbi:hypothetical protein GWK47_038130 [Chionoecetes opilio]|uniref:Uncharacterized protein n=1 Tax=Chionoecetes opilio TaxID=41210 RepID=A0A8J4YE96_CHIOP|nr:hypothetical protein GWK47_038130 [Chionoecetes opilio]
MAAAVVSALETWGVADQVVGSPSGTTASNTRAPETGPVSSRTENGERPAAFCLSSPYPGVVVHAVFVFPVLGCSSSPEHLLFKRFQTSWESIDREDFGTGIMVEEVADCSRGPPRLDLELIKALGTYDKIDPEIGDVALSKLSKPNCDGRGVPAVLSDRPEPAVVNDHAERGVALIQEFNGSLTKDEEQLQFLLQVVADHRKAFPDPREAHLAHTQATVRSPGKHDTPPSSG